MSPNLDILMPVYNREDMVLEALDSLRNQTYKDFNVIIYDDGSTDKTVEVIRKFIESTRMPNVYILLGEENKGVGYARNKLFEYSKAIYCMWMDSDDISHPQRAELMMDYIRKTDDDMVFSDLYFFTHPNGYNQSNNRKGIDLSKYTDRDGLNNNMNFATGIFKGIIRNVSIPNRRSREDIEWLTSLIDLRINFGYLQKGLYYVRRHDNRLTYMTKRK